MINSSSSSENQTWFWFIFSPSGTRNFNLSNWVPTQHGYLPNTGIYSFCHGISVVGALFTQSQLCLGIWLLIRKNVFAYTSTTKQPWSVAPLSIGKLVMTQLWMDGWMDEWIPNWVDVRFHLGGLSCKATSVCRMDKLDAL
jgi:hypothetical protein